MTTDLERFLSHVDTTPTARGCLLWTGAPGERGYGQFQVGGRAGQKWKPHRWVYFILTGELPRLLRHMCDTPTCVNIEHLEPGTTSDNMQDAVRRGRFKGMGPTCQRGHDDWGVQASGARWCLECKRMRNRRWKASRR